MLKWKQD